MRRPILCIMLLLVFFNTLMAQHADPKAQFQSRYHMIDSSELFVPLLPGKAFTPTAPPAGFVRPVAEWEPAQAVLIAYPGNFGVPYSLIAELSQDTRVITIVETSNQQNTVTNNYNNNGVNMANCSFHIAPLNSYWVRDFGPWFIMVNNEEIAVVDFPYNRPSRADDDNIPVVMSSYLGMNLYGMNLMHTGGNYMCDGMGAAASTDLVTDENMSLNLAQIDTLMKQFMGVDRHYITADPLGDYIKHIDCWGKFLDVDKILIASVPVSNPQYNEYEAMAAFWASQISSYGNNYQVFRVYEPDGQPYSNSLILNNKVFVPISSSFGTTNNNNALAVYQAAMPGYEIFGIESNWWESTDALHCRTHEVADNNMLYIQHLPLLGIQTIAAPYLITANIYALSDSSIIADSVWLSYRINNGSWQILPMTSSAAPIWQAGIPQQSPGDSIEYYIHASDNSPRSVTHPLIGQWDPHKFYLPGNASVYESAEPEPLIFPNPANTALFVQMQGKQSSKAEISLFHSGGGMLRHYSESGSGSQMIIFNTSGLPSGSYYLMIKTQGKQICKKVMIMH